MPEVLTSDIKILLKRAIRKFEDEKDKNFDAYENKHQFFEELAREIAKKTKFKINSGTLYKNMYIKLKNFPEKTVSYSRTYLNALSKYVNEKEYVELYPIGAIQIFKKYNEQETKSSWEEEFIVSAFAKAFDKKLTNNPLFELSKPVKELNLQLLEIFKKKVFDNKQKTIDSLKVLNIAEEDLNNFILAFPTFLMQNLTYRNRDFKNFRFFKYIEDNQPFEISGKQGVVTAHTLSPYSDSIALFLSLGNILRIAEIFEIEKRKIMLADPEWARLNKGVRFFEVPTEILEHAKRYRLKLTQTLGIETDVCKPSDLKGIYLGQNELDQLEDTCQAYEDICKMILPEDSVNKHLTPEERELLLSQLDSYEHIKKNSPKLFEFMINKLVKDDFNVHLQVIKSVIEHIGYVSKDTFYYFLLQRYFQHQYNGFLKIANMREFDFDKPLRDLNLEQSKKYHGLEDYVLGGIYFKDYYFDREENTVHPYCFPSGRLLKKHPDIKEAEKRAILIKDSDESKIFDLVNSVSETMLANIIADLLSFARIFAIKTENEELVNYIYWLLQLISPEFSTAWKVSFRKKSKFNEMIFGSWLGLKEIPYYFFPYIVFLKYDEKYPNNIDEKSLHEQDKTKRTIKKIYTKLILITISEVRKYIMEKYHISSYWGFDEYEE